MKKSKPLLYDPLIINRVKQYLEDNVHKSYLSVGVIAKHLQECYPEYSRRKVGPFRALVAHAYRIVCHGYGLKNMSDIESEASDLEDTNPLNNLMSNMMHNLYNKPKQKGEIAGNDAIKQPTGEAIDISSDENSDDSCSKSNGEILNAGHNIKAVANASTDQQNYKSPAETSLTPTCTQQIGYKRHQNSMIAPLHSSKKYKVASHDMQRPHSQQSATNHQQYLRDKISRSVRSQNTPNIQRLRKFKKEVQLRKSRETFQDIGGMEKTLKELCELLMHIKSPDIYFVLGLMPPRGILLYGPTGCGKTLLAHAIAGQLNLPLIEVPATELVAGISGESEERIRDVFEQAAACAPCVLFIDEIDAVTSNRTTAHKDMERRIVTQLISSLDNLKLTEGGQSVLVIGATTRPDVLDPALRRVGRFDHEVAIGIPTRKDRKDILNIICDGLSVEPKCDYDKIAELTPGYVGADLLALVSRAATIAVKRKCSQQMRDFQLKARKNITIVDLDDDIEDNSSNPEENKTYAEPISNVFHQRNTCNTTNTSTNDSITPSDLPANTGLSDKDKSLNVEKSCTTTPVDEQMKMPPPDQLTEINVHKNDNTAKGDSTDMNSSHMHTAENHLQCDANYHEPTLFELLNWLDNPPEDITFVSEFCITLEDFCEAVKVVQPSAKREGFITVPDVTWDDIGSLQNVREELKLAVLAPVKYPEKLSQLGLSAPSGVLLCGPPGCGKTLLAKAIANEAGINFISVKGPELINMYVGESERAVRACFQRARNSSPCVIFFDEFDSLCPKRSDGNENGSGSRVVNQLLTEMDGIEERQGVYVLAATNRPDIIDPAILRPGRLDTILYVDFPEEADRVDILKATTKNRTKPILAEDISFEQLAAETDGYTGADLAGLVRQAAMLALKESLNDNDSSKEDLCVKKEHFEQALKMLRPSVSPQERKIYQKLYLKYAAPHFAFDNTDAN